jgi:hypothetical protein
VLIRTVPAPKNDTGLLQAAHAARDGHGIGCRIEKQEEPAGSGGRDSIGLADPY